jgi:hypothetical protein
MNFPINNQLIGSALIHDKEKYEEAYQNFMIIFTQSQGNWVELFLQGNIRVWIDDPRKVKFYTSYGILLKVEKTAEEMRKKFDDSDCFKPPTPCSW